MSVTRRRERPRHAGWPVRDRDAVGRTATLVEPVQTGLVRIPAGTVVTLTGTYAGRFHIYGTPCTCCEVRIYARKVARSALRLDPETREPT